MKKIKTISFVLLLISSIVVFAACGSSKSDYYGANEFAQIDLNVNRDNVYKTENIIENDYVSASENNTSSFKLDRNTANYSLVRRVINSGMKVDEESVRIEELINYFNYSSFSLPQDNKEIALSYGTSTCPWNSSNILMNVAVATNEIKIESQTNNIVLLIDVSGSMYNNDRLPLAKQAIALMVENLTEKDIVSIVTYASGVRTVLRGESCANKSKIIETVDNLTASGSTYGESGIESAYSVAESFKNDYQNNRVILMTDGDFNVGKTSKTELQDLISEKRESGIYLSVLGFGMNNTNDITMKTLAENGNGNYGYIDTLLEAKKLLVEEIGGTFLTVAKDAKSQVVFNSDNVQEYRLIGYESKLLTAEEFDNEKTDSGEIGSGLMVSALYEVKLKPEAGNEIASFNVKYKTTTDVSKEEIIDVSLGGGNISEADKTFISCVAEFGLLLRNSEYKGTSSFESVASRLNTLNLENDVYKSEFGSLVAKASEIYSTSLSLKSLG